MTTSNEEQVTVTMTKAEWGVASILVGIGQVYMMQRSGFDVGVLTPELLAHFAGIVTEKAGVEATKNAPNQIHMAAGGELEDTLTEATK